MGLFTNSLEKEFTGAYAKMFPGTNGSVPVKDIVAMNKRVHISAEHGYRLIGPIRSKKKISAKSRCPCGSGKQYRKCCRPKHQKEVQHANNGKPTP